MLRLSSKLFHGFPKEFFKGKQAHGSLRGPAKLPQALHSRVKFQKSLDIIRIRPIEKSTAFVYLRENIKKSLKEVGEYIKNIDNYLKEKWFQTEIAAFVYQKLYRNVDVTDIVARHAYPSLKRFWDLMCNQGAVRPEIFNIDRVFFMHVCIVKFFDSSLKPLHMKDIVPSDFMKFCQAVHAGAFPVQWKEGVLTKCTRLNGEIFRSKFQHYLHIFVELLLSLVADTLQELVATPRWKLPQVSMASFLSDTNVGKFMDSNTTHHPARPRRILP